MTPVEVGLVGQAVLAAAGLVGALASPGRWRSPIVGLLSAALGVAGAVTGAMVLAGGGGRIAFATALPLGDLTFEPVPLGGFFLLVIGAVGAVASVYAIGYADGPASSRTAWATWPLFLVAMQLVPAAADVLSFLLTWEMMAVASTVLVLTEHTQRREVRSAAVWYAAMTHLSFVLLLLGFGVLAWAGGGLGFAQLASVDPASGSATAAYLLLVAGFATKAGVVPLHVWLPRAHPAAPSHVSAVMSAAMVKVGVYGTVLVSLRLLPGGPGWWGLMLVGLGAVSAVYGILQASVTSDLKRLLAYSTTENVGLMFLALGAALLFGTVDAAGPERAAVTACLLLVASHAAFKTALFLAAGSLVHGSGERDLDRMGGFQARMPVTAIAFGVGAVGAAALPVSVGFVAEWTLLQSLIHGGRPEDRLVAVALPAAVSVVALTAGLALLTFVKAYGVAFLARPRSEGAAAAHEAGPTMGLAMLTAAAAVVGLGLLPGPLLIAVNRAAGLTSVDSDRWGGVDLSGIGAVLDPVPLALLGVVLAAPVVAVALVASRRRPRRRVDLAWGCGGVRVSPRMQYTATSYAEPLARVFDDALRPERDIEVTHASESRYLVERVQFRQRLDDVVEVRVYRRVVALLDRLGLVARRLQNGSIHRYLAYSFGALVVVLVVVAL